MKPSLASALAITFLTCPGAIPVSAGVLELDGIDSWVELTNTDGGIPSGADAFTVEAWVNPDVHNDGHITFWGEQAGNAASGFRLRGGGATRHYFWGNDHDTTGTGDLSDDTSGPGSDGWHHLGVVWDGSQTQWYWNGDPLEGPRAAAGVNVTDANHRIGSRLGDEFYDGYLDEIRIWDRARSADEMAASFDDELPTNTVGLVAYYKFDAESDFSDATGNGHDGTPMGFGAMVETTLNAPVSPTEDSDGDGLPDDWEELWFGEGNLSQGPDDNPDDDGLSNGEEFATNRALDPTVADTDGDGLEDGPEVNTHMTDPLDDDSDDDTLLDGAEVNTHMTSPTDADSDDDTVDDATEIADGTDPNDPNDPPSTAGFGALCLDGLSFVSFSNDAGLIPSGDAPFTIESWINPTSIPAGGDGGGQITFWGTQGPTDTANGFRLRGSAGVRHYFWGNDHDENFLDEGGAPLDILDDVTGPNGDGWHHLAVTYSGSETQWYFNGAPLGPPRAVAGVAVADQNHRIGSRLDAEFFDGWIDELRIWDVARSGDEIADNFGLSIAPDETGLVAYWNFTDGYGDVTGNGHDGTPMASAIISNLQNAPVSGTARLEITGIAFDEGTRTATITWASRVGRTYAVDFSPDLGQEWSEIDDGLVADSESSSFDDVVPDGVLRRYYRVRDVNQ
ncbi:MAG: LamG domain-containing protein [Verrucomicrobiales bacterium]